MTNQNAFGVQNLFVPRDADVSFASLQSGMNIIEGNSKPEPINFTATPAEIFKFLDTLIQAAETISGVNSVARGNPEASLKSGAALALVQSMSLQFVSGLQQSYVKIIEDVGTALINILKDFAKTPKVIALVGKNNRTELKEFTGEQISSINRVVVDVGNPLSRTIAGRVQMAEQMLQMNLIKSPQQYFQVMNTGRLDSMFEGELSELMLIKSENERMMEGEDVEATALDAHRLHIMEHKSVLADPDLRRDPVLTEKVFAHILQHIELLRGTDPDLLALIGEQPLPPLDQPLAPTPTGQSIPIQGQNIPDRTLERSPMSGIMGEQQAAPVSGPGIEQQALPEMPRPPAPFENAPISPQEMPTQ
jgi:carbon monoxide dehydrogenase subunit G